MATTYMYLNNGQKVPLYGNTAPQAFSGPYRAIVTEDTKPAASSKKTTVAKQTPTQTSDAGAAALAEELRKQREAEAARAAEEARRRQEKINNINKSKAAEMETMSQNLDMQKKLAAETNNDNLRQLYIAYMQGLRGIPQQQALWGAGGEIESLKKRSRLNYENNRASENRSYAGILSQIQQQYNDDLNELEKKYLQMLLNV